MRKTIKAIGICGLAIAGVLIFSGCAGFGGGDKEKETTTYICTVPTLKPTVETETATESTTATTTTKATETTESAELGHGGSTVVATEPQVNNYIISGSDSRYLSRDDLKGLSAEKLRLARNEIYARHGNIFKDEALNEYFEKQAWYNPIVKSDDFDEKVLNDYEKENIALIKKLEKEMSGAEQIKSDASTASSERDKVLKTIEGSWTTGGNSGLIHKSFKGDTMTDSTGGSEKITDVVKFSNSDGEGYQIYLEGGTIYYLFDDDPDFLECHNVSGGYSGADSLVRD